jgi:hypothetical protein
LQEHHHHFDKPLMAHDKILVESEVASWLGDNVLRPLASVASQNLPLPKYDHDKLIEETSHFNVTILCFSFFQQKLWCRFFYLKLI